jgi:hypothetical protein
MRKNKKILPAESTNLYKEKKITSEYISKNFVDLINKINDIIHLSDLDIEYLQKLKKIN